MVATSKKKLNPIEKAKAQKHPLLFKADLERFASMGWEALEEENDFALKQGLKWLGFFIVQYILVNLCCGCEYPMASSAVAK